MWSGVLKGQTKGRKGRGGLPYTFLLGGAGLALQGRQGRPFHSKIYKSVFRMYAAAALGLYTKSERALEGGLPCALCTASFFSFEAPR